MGLIEISFNQQPNVRNLKSYENLIVCLPMLLFVCIIG